MPIRLESEIGLNWPGKLHIHRGINELPDLADLPENIRDRIEDHLETGSMRILPTEPLPAVPPPMANPANDASIATRAEGPDELHDDNFPRELGQLAKALGHPVRIAIVLALGETSELGFPALRQLSRSAPSTICGHLEVLQKVNLVERIEDTRRRTFYRLNRERLGRARALVTLLSDRTGAASGYCTDRRRTG